MHDASDVIFGLDPLWVSTALLLMTYAVIMSEKVNRAVVALLGAGLMICLGVINQEAAIRGVDFNTIALLTGMMLRSANDACVVAALKISGSVPAFSKLMNARARELGCVQTHFTNPNGLPNPYHVSTARDLATMGRASRLALPGT